MRGEDTQKQTLFSYVRTDDRIPGNHPVRLIRQIADGALAALSDQFDAVYAAEGRPSIPPERLGWAAASPQPSSASASRFESRAKYEPGGAAATEIVSTC
jgi:hypothetical protein